MCSPVVSQVELPQCAAAPERLEVAHQHVLGEEELLERRAPPQRLEPARQLVVPARMRVAQRYLYGILPQEGATYTATAGEGRAKASASGDAAPAV